MVADAFRIAPGKDNMKKLDTIEVFARFVANLREALRSAFPSPAGALPNGEAAASGASQAVSQPRKATPKDTGDQDLWV